MTRLELAPGLVHVPAYLDRARQEALRDALAAVMEDAPPFRPRMPKTGTPFSVRMTNCGELGWVSDEGGYRYQSVHPDIGRPWPDMPPILREAWSDLSGYRDRAEACLINLYGASARMGLHQDRDEAALDAPVVSLSLGDTAVFRVGGLGRRDPTRSVRLSSGDAVVIGGASRLAFHGIDRLIAGSSTLLSGGGRINCTLRRVTAPAGSAP